jgi:hypothetical protein
MITRKDYELCLDKICKILKDDVHSIYEYGTYKNPGLSDIDLILVANENNLNLRKKIKKIKSEFNFFFEFSNIIIANKNMIKYIKYFDNLRLNKIFGSKLSFKEPKKKDFLLLKYLEIMDWAPERLIRLIEIKKDYIDRKNFGLINSTKYTLKNINFFLKKKKYEKLIYQIENLRLNYKNVKQTEMKRIIKTLINHLLDALKEISKINFFLQNKYFSPEYSALSFPNNSKIFFNKNEFKIDKRKNYLYVPKCFGYNYFYYINHCANSSLSKMIKKYYYVKNSKKILLHSNIELLNILKIRCKYLSENIDFLKEKKITKGLYKFGWFL